MSSHSTASKPRRHWLLRLLFSLSRIALVLALFLTGCQSKLIYFPSRYESREPEEFTGRGGKRLDFTTGEGNQCAWLMLPADGKPVDHLWVVCSGNAARALDMEHYFRHLPFPGDAFLLIDYPGYGACEGSPHPDTIRETLRAAIPRAAETLGLSMEDLKSRASVFGHSLGCAAALMAAEEFGLRGAVLCAPFTSTMDMTRVLLKVPLGFLVHHRFDNRARLSSLQAAGGRAWIFHGSADEVIPVRMGRTLAEEFSGIVRFTEAEGADHNFIMEAASREIMEAMGTCRRRE
jgi:uncharacterized protein